MALPDRVLTTTVTGTYTDWQGNPCAGAVTLTPSVCRLVDAEDGVVIAGGMTAVLDTTGSFSAEVVSSQQDAIEPKDFCYVVTETTSCSGCTRSYTVAVPADGAGLDLSEVLNNN